MTALLILIYISFISLGLPDSLLGAAWPVMHGDLGADISLAGLVAVVVAAGTVISSLFSARWIARFGTAKVTAVSVLFTAVALLGSGLASSLWVVLLFAVPLGLGAGAIDSALNNFVALHYQARQMNWLHCFWGLGASFSPVLVGTLLSVTGTWRSGYLGIAAIQGMFAAILLATLPLWKKALGQGAQTEEKPRVYPFKEIIARPLAKPVFLAMLCYCGAEFTIGTWSASFLVEARGIAPETAAAWAATFFAGIMAGRFLSGVVAIRWKNRQLIRLGQMVAVLGILLLLLPAPTWLLPVALFVVGLGFAPVFPGMIHQTPHTFGTDISQAMIGVEMAFAYIGNISMPPFFGLVGSWLGMQTMPLYVSILVAAMILCTEYVARRAKDKIAA